MADGRKNNGGKRPGSGRKSKKQEDKIANASIAALTKTFGSVEKAMIHAAQKGSSNDKDSFAWFKLVIEYAYGKPVASHELSGKNGTPLNFNIQIVEPD